jgi:hypothetical protein
MQHRPGKEQDQESDHGQRHREPQGLTDFLADLDVAARTVELRGDRLERGQNAGQTDIDGDIDRRTEPERGQIDGRITADHRRVDHAERDDRQLADQHGPC